MNVVLMPMWLVSGALFPIAGAYSWMGWVMRANPMTYGLSAVRTAMMPGDPGPFGIGVSMAVIGACALAAFVACAATIRGERPDRP